MREEVLAILKNVREDIDFVKESYLIDHEILDSMDVVGIATEFMDYFHIDIDADDIEPENFNSLDAMINMINRKMTQ